MDAAVASALKKSSILFAFEAFFFEVENELCRDEKTKTTLARENWRMKNWCSIDDVK